VIRSRTLALLSFSAILLSANLPATADVTPAFQPSLRTASFADSTYFVMTDRFANGDTANDLGGAVDFRLASGFDESDPGFYHGGDLKGLISKLQYIKNLGFTSLWVTPPVAQKTVQGGSAAYHGYWGLDFTTIDKHLGTESDFQNLIKSAHALGLKVIVDIVVNHTADVIQYDQKNKAYIPAGQGSIKKPAFLNQLSNYHNQGDSTFTGKSLLTGDFYGLDDLYTEKSAVRKGWTDLWSGWIKKYKFDGFRIDTARHVEPGFWQTFLPAILKVAHQAGIPKFVVFGEIADSNPENVAPFVTEEDFQSALDFPFQAALTRYVSSPGGASVLADLFNADDLYTTSATNAYSLRTFLGNHDMGRIGYFLQKIAGWDGPDVVYRRDVLAQSLLMLLRGSPIIYYGDEKGMAGGGGDKLARQDMFATQVSDWQTEPRIGQTPIGTASSFDVTNPLEKVISSLNELRAHYPDLVAGAQQVRVASGDLFAVTRSSGKNEYVIAANSGDSPADLTTPVTSLGSGWRELFGDGSLTSAAPGSVTVHLPGQGLFVAQATDFSAPQSSLIVKMNPIATDLNTQGWIPLTASIPGEGYNQVDFMVRTHGGQWQNVGTADRRTFAVNQTKGGLYRAYLHPARFKKGTQLEVQAIGRDSYGNEKSSSVLTYTITS
jgi:glycosidase